MDRLKLFELLVFQQVSGERSRSARDDAVEFVVIDNVFGAQAGDERAAARCDINESFLTEHDERFTDRTATDVKGPPDGVLVDLDAGAQRAGEDKVPHVRRDVVGEAAPTACRGVRARVGVHRSVLGRLHKTCNS